MKPKSKKKSRMGRPTIGPERRPIPVLIRVSEREKRTWSKQAKLAGMALGPWIVKPRRDEMGEGK